MKTTAMALAVSIPLLGAASARGAEFTAIQYDLAGSTGVISVPLQGSGPATGTLTLAFESSGGAPIASGRVKLLSFSVLVDPLTVVFVTGSVREALFGGTIHGAHLTAGHRVSGSAAVGTVLVTGFLHCNQTTGVCGIAQLLASSPVPVSHTQPFSIGNIQFSSGGGFGGFTHTRPFVIWTNPPTGPQAFGTLLLTGSEISRTTMEMPEPGGAPLVAMCALMLAVATVGRRLLRR